MSLDIKKKEMELKRVLMAKDEFELRIAEREDEILKIKSQMAQQDEAAEKIKKELEILKNK